MLGKIEKSFYATISTNTCIFQTHPPPEETLANVFHALVSALKASSGIAQASMFVRDFLVAVVVEKDIAEIWCPEKPLQLLNEILERENKKPAEPRLLAEAGANTLLPVYQVGLYSNKKYLGLGKQCFLR